MNFMKKFHVDRGYIISSNQKETLEIDNKHISVTPAYQFLLEQENVGHS
jgi:hypothetical protein